MDLSGACFDEVQEHVRATCLLLRHRLTGSAFSLAIRRLNAVGVGESGASEQQERGECRYRLSHLVHLLE